MYGSGNTTSKWQTAAVWPRMVFFPMPEPRPDQLFRLENYLFYRYIHTILRIFILLALTLLPILLPMNILGGKNEAGGVKGLDRLGFSNVGPSHADRYWAHLLAAIFVVVSVCLVLQGELQSYSRFQQATEAAQFEGSSILIVSTSKKPLSCKTIRNYFSSVSGGVHSIEMNRDFRHLHAKISHRDALITKLEAAETDLIRKANRSRKMLTRALDNEGFSQHNYSGELWKKYLRESDRPALFKWKTIPFFPFIGTKVDAIHHYRSEIVRCSIDIERDQRRPERFPSLNSAFVHFQHRLSTPLAILALNAQSPPSWTVKGGIARDDIIWQNLAISWWEQCIRTAIVYFLLVVLILGFALPVTITGVLSQVAYLVGVIPELTSLERLPDWIVAVIQGVLPPTMLALLTVMVPPALRVLANLQGLYSRRAVENSVQFYYFIFLFVQVFLVVSLSASITTVIKELGLGLNRFQSSLRKTCPRLATTFSPISSYRHLRQSLSRFYTATNC